MYENNKSILDGAHGDLSQSNQRLTELSSLRAVMGRSRPVNANAPLAPTQDKEAKRRCDGSTGNTSQSNNGWGLYEYPLAMVYSPYQQFRNIYTPEIALDRGTVFAELDLPFEAAGANGG